MSVPYWDNDDDEGQSGIIHVDRVYRFAFEEFTDSDWDEFDRVYESLPGYLNLGSRFFSAINDDIPYLWTSMEPPGLQVCGILPTADWLAWDEKFRTETAKLPFKSSN